MTVVESDEELERQLAAHQSTEEATPPSVAPRASARVAEIPHAPEAERALLGAMLVAPLTAGLEALDTGLQGEHFYSPRFSAAFRGARACLEAGDLPDAVTIRAHAAEDLDAAGGWATFDDLAASAVGTVNVAAWAAQVIDAADRRRGLAGIARAKAAIVAGAPLEDALAELATLEPHAHTGRLESLILPAHRLSELPAPEPLIEGLLFRRSLGLIVGPQGVAKSFLAQAFAAHIATGTPWLDHQVHQGHALYVAAEGAEGLDHRFQAWRLRHQRLDIDGLFVLPATVNLFDPASVREVLALLRRHPFELVIIDTLSRSIAGAEENSARDMSQIVAALDQIKDATGGTVLVVHHTSKAGESARGSGALEAAADTVLRITANDGAVQVKCGKQKNAAEFAPIDLRLSPLGPSATLTRATAGDPVNSERMSLLAVKVLAVLANIDTGNGIGVSVWQEAAQESSTISRTTFYRVRRHLVDRGLVAQVSDTQRAPWTLTDAGRTTVSTLPEQAS